VRKREREKEERDRERVREREEDEEKVVVLSPELTGMTHYQLKIEAFFVAQ
jgi:hypothetical protein